MISGSELRFVKGLDPVANAFSGTVGSDVINVSHFHKLFFLVLKGVGTTGTTTITVSACDDVVPTTETAVAFRYQKATTDVPGTWTEAATTGFATTAGSSDLYIVEVDMKAIASTGFGYCRLKMVELVASAVVGAVVIFGVPRFAPSSVAVTT